MTAARDDAVGGYFGLEEVRGAGLPHLQGASLYGSARSAMAAWLQAADIRAAWVPWFTCSAVDDALAFAGVRIERYVLDADRGPPDDLAMSDDACLVCIDYFGLSKAACDAAIERHGAARVLVDASQALFHSPAPGATTVYSPRKFAGMPDGGAIMTSHVLPAPIMADEADSAARTRHLELRAAGQLEAGYEAFKAAEDSLRDCRPVGMSRMTRALLDGIDADAVAARRVANYQVLQGRLASMGLLVPGLPDDAVPLCCPVTGVDARGLRSALASRKIFSPAYWPDANVPPTDPVGRELLDRTLYLPCDQRYGDAHMERIATALSELLGIA